MNKSEQQNSAIGKPIAEKPQSVDDILKIIKPIGRYQILAAFLYIYVNAPMSINSIFMGYGGLKPKWICLDPPANSSNTSQVMEPTANCEIYRKCSPENLTFVSDFYSVVSEWALVCDKEYLINLITSVQMAGQLVGAMAIGPISDLYGRKWIFVGVICLQFLIGGLSALSPNVTVFIAFRFVIGILTGAMVLGWVFTAETTTNRYRLLIRTIAIGTVQYWNPLLIGYLTRDWKWFSVFGNLEGIPVALLIIFLTFESPRWLAQKGRTVDAANVLRKIAKVNKTDHLLPDRIELETGSKSNKKYHVWHLFRTRRLTLYTTMCVINLFAASVAYYGSYYDMSNLSDDIYMNNVILASVNMAEISIGILDVCSANVNRKYLMLSFFTLGTICSISIALLQTVFSSVNAHAILLMLTSSIGVVATQSAFDLCYVYAIELFPTLLRSNATGLMSIFSRFGGVIAPQLLNFTSAWTPLPYVCFAAISSLAIIIDVLFLPNTKKMQLPETYEQASKETGGHKNVAYEENKDGSEIREKI